MKPAAICILLLSIVLLSFKPDKKKMILGTWHAVNLQSPQLDSFYKSSLAIIDTLGKNTDDTTNLQLYGTANMDSFRHEMRSQIDSAIAVQMNSVKSTVFDFRKDSIAVLSFDNAADSCKWYFDGAGQLVLKAINPQDELFNNLNSLNLQLVALSDTALKLKFVEESAYSIVTFHPERNKRQH